MNWAELFSSLPPHWATFWLAVLPVTELRVSLPLALTYWHLSWVVSYIFAASGNLLPILIVFIFLPPLIRFAKTHSVWLAKTFDRYFAYLEHKHKNKYDRYGAFFLALFVAIPLPITGAWTGAILAVLFNIKKQYSIPALIVGVMVMGALVLVLTLGVKNVIRLL